MALNFQIFNGPTSFVTVFNVPCVYQTLFLLSRYGIFKFYYVIYPSFIESIIFVWLIIPFFEYQ